MKDDAPVNVNADRLGYAGAGGAATYTGNVSLWQGETSIRADELRLDQSKGDLVASGSARATLMLAGKSSIGHGDEIRYEDATHTVNYDSRRPLARGRGTERATGVPALPPSIPGRGAAARGAVATGPMQAYLYGPQGELRAWRIAMVLTPADPYSMLLMAIPLCLLYVVGILMCKWMPRGRNPFAEAYEP